MPLLDKETITATIPDGWFYDENGKCIVREYTRGNFVDAVLFINRITPIAETNDHHPDILLHGYKKVRVTLATHSAGGVTGKDITLAKAINEI